MNHQKNIFLSACFLVKSLCFSIENPGLRPPQQPGLRRGAPRRCCGRAAAAVACGAAAGAAGAVAAAPAMLGRSARWWVDEHE